MKRSFCGPYAHFCHLWTLCRSATGFVPCPQPCKCLPPSTAMLFAHSEDPALQVSIDEDELRAWIACDAPPDNILLSSTAGGMPLPGRQLHSLRLFSTNDYLGLSTHQRVRQAAADAALAYGSGETRLRKDRQKGFS